MIRYALAILFMVVNSADGREFQTRSGFKFNAEIVEIDDSTVSLKGETGEIVKFPRRLLSAEDQHHVMQERNRRQRANAKDVRTRLIQEREADAKRCLQAQVDRKNAAAEKKRREREARAKARQAFEQARRDRVQQSILNELKNLNQPSYVPPVRYRPSPIGGSAR